ncbi:rhodanese-like domain-containing protein [Planctomicrobium sp. SH668]|uniref:rhodanese-like domain-containing protein n=1 Tax=Planctomicrobium sp. SH668 TaxID=3448126 RepID=UPI003F5C9179
MRVASRYLTVIAVSMIAASVGMAEEPTKESLAEVKKNVDDKKGVVVDVREKEEWDAGHVEGAIFLPLSEMQGKETDQFFEKLPKDKILYVHCVKWIRARSAGQVLSQRGYEVRVLKPGYKDLIEAGFPKAKM